MITDKEDNIMITAYEHNGLHYIRANKNMETNMSISIDKAHRRFGHASTGRLIKLQDSTQGVLINGQEKTFCESCAHGKSRRAPFPHERRTKPTRIFQIVSSDLKGPILVPGKGGHRYYITFNCLYSTWTWISFLKQKTSQEVLTTTQRFLTDAQAETGQRLETLLTDNGSEYVNREMSTYLLQKNIRHQRTVPYSPQQNGLAERRNQTIMGMTRCILIESQLEYEYWTFAVRYAVYTLNRLPTKSISWKTPHELWLNQKPDVSHMRPFGCTAFAHISQQLRTSLEPTSTRCTFLGYPQYQKGYVLEDTINQEDCDQS